MWPSRMARTASQMGSLKSSPSTSTVKKPVMEPRSKLPARSQTFGSRLKDGGRVAFLAGRFAGGETDLALGHGEAGDGIHDQQNVLALIAEILGDGEGDETGADAQRRGPVGSGDHDHGSRQPSGPRSCSRNPRTSRLRSPIRAITLTSAEL